MNNRRESYITRYFLYNMLVLKNNTKEPYNTIVFVQYVSFGEQQKGIMYNTLVSI